MILIQFIESSSDLVIVTSEVDRLLPQAGEDEEGRVLQPAVADDVIQQDVDPFDSQVSDGVGVIGVCE